MTGHKGKNFCRHLVDSVSVQRRVRDEHKLLSLISSKVPVVCISILDGQDLVRPQSLHEYSQSCYNTAVNVVRWVLYPYLHP